MINKINNRRRPVWTFCVLLYFSVFVPWALWSTCSIWKHDKILKEHEITVIQTLRDINKNVAQLDASIEKLTTTIKKIEERIVTQLQ